MNVFTNIKDVSCTKCYDKLPYKYYDIMYEAELNDTGIYGGARCKNCLFARLHEFFPRHAKYMIGVYTTGTIL